MALDRRSFVKRAAITAGLLSSPRAFAQNNALSGLSSEGVSKCFDPPSGGAPSPQRAVSLLKLLQSNPGPKARLPGLSRLDGYVETTEDVVLWGQAEPGRPDLYLEDFIVALRAMIKQARDKSEADPLISIDPLPERMADARSVEDMAPSDNGARRKRLQEEYAEKCSAPQTVRVEGMPRNTRIAKILVDADYRMKMVAQGRVRLPVNPPLRGRFDTAWEQQKKEAAGSSPSTEGTRTSTRYWFHPGAFKYQLDANTAYLETAQVSLSTEDQVLGGAAASGNIDPVAQRFVCEWTQRMDEIRTAEPIWREMHDVFRHFAVARALVKEARLYGKQELRKLVDAYQFDETPLPDTLPGLSRWVMQDMRTKTGKGILHQFIQYRVCGGVSMGLTRALGREIATRRSFAGVDYTIMRSRENPQAISWTVGALQEPPSGFTSTYNAEYKPPPPPPPQSMLSKIGDYLAIPAILVGFGVFRAMFRSIMK